MIHDDPTFRRGLHLGVPRGPEAGNGTESGNALLPLPCLAIRSKSSTLSYPDSRATSQVMSLTFDRRNRIHDDEALVHPITATRLYMGTRPDADAASDPPAPDSLAEALREQHGDNTSPDPFLRI
jgi:hypothetical protein